MPTPAGAQPEHVLRTKSAGYELALDEEIDLRRFERRSDAARTCLRAGGHDAAVAHFARALALWHGAPLGGVTAQLAATHGPR